MCAAASHTNYLQFPHLHARLGPALKPGLGAGLVHCYFQGSQAGSEEMAARASGTWLGLWDLQGGRESGQRGAGACPHRSQSQTEGSDRAPSHQRAGQAPQGS